MTWSAALAVWALACTPASKTAKPVDTTVADVVEEPDEQPDATDGEEPVEDSGTGDDGVDSGAPATPWDEGPPPVVVLFIGDGMGLGHVEGAGLVAHGTAGSLFMETAPHIGRLRTASLSGYTDSAAAATTLATGHKTGNGRIGQDLHGTELEGLADLAHLRGLSVGVVTTDTLTGATPSAFLTHAANRYDTEAIAAGLAAEPPEVMLGGGAVHLRHRFGESPALVVETAEALASAPVDLSRPLVGVIAELELPFLVDMVPDAPTPRLPALVSAALDHLLADPDGALLVVEAARIDHASHLNNTRAVFPEVLELDQAIEETVTRLAELEDRAVTVLVTADHETGGLQIIDPTLHPEHGLPGVSWRWLDHTNQEVPVFAWGEGAALLADESRQSGDAWAVLDGALRSRAPAPPAAPRLPDGKLDDLGSAVVVQTVETDFGAGFNQLDALRVAVDERGLWVGIDGIVDERANAVTIWLDLDHGEGTGVGADMTLTDTVGAVDQLLARREITTGLGGLGFDAAISQVGATYARAETVGDTAGARQFQPPAGMADDLAWKRCVVNFDDGNVADGAPARDADSTGETEHGMEVFVAWQELWEEGLPAEGAQLALVATLSSGDGVTWSNQALPPQEVSEGEGTVRISSVVTLGVDPDGQLRSGPSIER